MPVDTDTPHRQQARDRLRRRLAVVADDRWPERVRIAAIKAIQSSFDPRHWLNDTSARNLLESVLNKWDVRPSRDPVTGRVREMQVRRPPEGLADVWRL